MIDENSEITVDIGQHKSIPHCVVVTVSNLMVTIVGVFKKQASNSESEMTIVNSYLITVFDPSIFFYYSQSSKTIDILKGHPKYWRSNNHSVADMGNSKVNTITEFIKNSKDIINYLHNMVERNMIPNSDFKSWVRSLSSWNIYSEIIDHNYEDVVTYQGGK